MNKFYVIKEYFHQVHWKGKILIQHLEYVQSSFSLLLFNVVRQWKNTVNIISFEGLRVTEYESVQCIEHSIHDNHVQLSARLFYRFVFCVNCDRLSLIVMNFRSIVFKIVAKCIICILWGSSSIRKLASASNYCELKLENETELNRLLGASYNFRSINTFLPFFFFLSLFFINFRLFNALSSSKCRMCFSGGNRLFFMNVRFRHDWDNSNWFSFRNTKRERKPKT